MSHVIPLSEKDLAFWRTEIQQARQTRQGVADLYGWEDNLKRYVPKPLKNALGVGTSDVNIGADFRDVERKKAALFFDTPTIALAATQDRLIPMRPDAPLPQPMSVGTLLTWHQELLNTLLGPKHANVKPTILKAIFDCLCPAGVGPVSVGYQVTMQTVQRDVPLIDPLTQQPVLTPPSLADTLSEALGVGVATPPQPVMETVDVELPIYERWFISRFSPKALLIPASFRDTDFARAPWLGKDWRKPLSQVKRDYQLPDDWTGGTADDAVRPFFDNGETVVDQDTAGDPYVSGVDLTYHTQLRADAEVHPLAMRQLVLVDGHDTPVVHRDSPYQDFDDETGALTPDSLVGFVDRPLVLRDLSDSAWIPSDCSVTGALTKELDKYRTQIIEQRDGNKMVIAFDSSKIDPTAKDKIVSAGGVKWVPLEQGALAQGKDTIMTQVAQAQLGRENYMGQDIIERDREQILGIGANQNSVTARGRKTATEQTIVQRNSEARFEQERQRVQEWYLDVVSAFDTLVLRYADARMASDILGADRGTVWAQYKDALAGGYTYAVQVDSGKYLDVEADRRQALAVYNQLRQDPFVNPTLLLKDIAEKFGHDPAEFIREPPKADKELKASFSFKADDLNPLAPQFALVVKLMRQAGWDVNEQDVQLAQGQAQALGQGVMPVSGVGPDPRAPQAPPPHPGAMPMSPTINQHAADLTGQRSGPPVDPGSVM